MRTWKWMVQAGMKGLALAAVLVWSGGAFAAGDGAPVVRNGAEPLDGRSTLNLEEMWRVGGPDGDLLFGHLLDATADADGRVYVLDAQLCEVQVFGPDGEHIGALGRDGDGPGEFRRPARILIMPDGSCGVLARFPGRIIKLDLGGDPAGTVDITTGGQDGGELQAVYYAGLAGNGLAVLGNEREQRDNGWLSTWYLAICDADGHEKARPFAVSAEVDLTRPAIVEQEQIPGFLFATTTGPDGRVYIAQDWDRYEIHVYAPDGSLERVIAREHSPRRRSAAEMARLQAIFDTWAQRMPFEVAQEIEENAPAVAGLSVAEDGALWVRSDDGRPADGIFAIYDVFDRSGRFVRQVSVACEGDPRHDKLLFVGNDRAVLIRGAQAALANDLTRGGIAPVADGTDELEVVCYGVPRV